MGGISAARGRAWPVSVPGSGGRSPRDGDNIDDLQRGSEVQNGNGTDATFPVPTEYCQGSVGAGWTIAGISELL